MSVYSKPLPADPSTYRAQVRRDRNAGHLRRYQARTLLSICDLAARQGRLIPNISERVGFMGLGQLRPALTDTDRDPDWFFVHELVELTGATWDQWLKLRDEELDEAREEPPVTPRVDEYTVHTFEGDSHQVPVCNWQVGLMLALEGPWGKELMSNVTPAFRRALVETGIGDTIQVARLDGDGTAHMTGETLTEAILADGPLPSPEVVRHQIQAGPLAALHQDGDGR